MNKIKPSVALLLML